MHASRMRPERSAKIVLVTERSVLQNLGRARQHGVRENSGGAVVSRSDVVLASLGVCALSAACLAAAAAQGPAAPAVRIAVFKFELDDQTPAAALQNKATSTAAAMDRVSEEARSELAQSGKYSVIDASSTDMNTVPNKAMRDCEGCEAGMALKLGADQALIGVVKRATQTDYYVWIQIRDARTGKILDQEAANFAGSEEGWPSGVRMLIRHQVLPAKD
jgi:curli biogenesis system outer membrane secretion channel CsgG